MNFKFFLDFLCFKFLTPKYLIFLIYDILAVAPLASRGSVFEKGSEEQKIA